MGSYKISKMLLSILYVQNRFYARIKTYRAIDVNSLFGYMGGYVGVLLGCSILQIPDLLLWALGTIKRCVQMREKLQPFSVW